MFAVLVIIFVMGSWYTYTACQSSESYRYIMVACGQQQGILAVSRPWLPGWSVQVPRTYVSHPRKAVKTGWSCARTLGDTVRMGGETEVEVEQ